MWLLNASFCKKKGREMTDYTSGFEVLHPINFMTLNKLTESIKDLDAILLFSKIKFHENHSKLTLKNGMKCITRTRKKMAKWFDFGVSKVDRLLRLLESKGFLIIEKGMWYGKRQLFIATAPEKNYISANIKLLTLLTEETGCLKATVLFARIAFAMRGTKITYNNQKWCCLTREEMASLLSTSLRTVDAIVRKLIKDGLIVAQNLVFKKKRRLHFSIPEKILNSLREKALIAMKKTGVIEPANSHFCRSPKEEPAKIEFPIRVSENSLKENNNTIIEKSEQKRSIENKKPLCDINFDKISGGLNKRQVCFLLSALRKTIKQAKINVSSEKELLEEVIYSILNPEQRKGVLSFKHAVSRCMQLLRQHTWRTPFGFHRYAEYGKEIKASREAQLQVHEARKREECNRERKTKWQTEDYTAQGIRWAQKLSTYFQEMRGKVGSDAELMLKIDFSANRVIEFIDKGADRTAIKPYLPSEQVNW